MNKLKILVFLFFILVCCGIVKQASAQTLPPNIATANVDDYSDQQIRDMFMQVQSTGFTQAQILQKLQSSGMSNSNYQKLQTRIQNLQGKEVVINNTNDANITGARQLNYKPDSLDATINKKDNPTTRIFGADLFNGKSNTFEPNLNIPTPVNYILGPNDQLNINVFGKSVISWTPKVSPDGNINIPNVGIINVGGKPIEVAQSIIKSKLSAYYPVGNGANVSITLGNIRSIKVSLIGYLVRPNTYTVPSLTSVFGALYAAGGPTENGTLRQIEVIRNSKKIRTLDLYDFLLKGDQKDNITLQDGDIVRVPVYRTRVELSGQVKTPALFEVLPAESLQDILNYAGGFTDKANTASISISQIKDQQRTLTDVTEADYKNYIPLRGDKFTIGSIIDRIENRVTIQGAVFRPADYELNKGLTLSGLIEKAAGVKEDAFDRGSITRLKPDNTLESISFSLKDVLNKTVTIPLQREDVVNIPSIFDLHDKYYVTINGAVRKPGTIAFADGMKIEDLIVKANGFAEGASSKRIEVSRIINDADPLSKNSNVATVFSRDVDSLLRSGSSNFVLKPFDIVYVYSQPGYEKQKTVRIEGEVLYPGPYPIETKNEKISDLVAKAGGLTASADIEGGSLKRDNTAILGIDKNKSDTTAIALEHAQQINRLKKVYKDSTDNQPRNNNVGIDLPEILRSPGSKIDLLLEDGDVIRIPKQQQIVRVNGEVLYPSAVVYDNEKSFNEYVLNAGGYGPDALKKRAYIVYPNGTVKGTRKILFFNSHPKVKPGSEIYVPKKAESKGNTIQEVLAFATGIASLGAIILGIISVTRSNNP